VVEAAAALGFDPARSIVIGDKSTDIELGRRLSALTMLVSASGRASDGAWVEPDFVVGSLLEAARITEELEGGLRTRGRPPAA
jgi:phosphoglycolate phosphatase-like HAD superfamily hydrolase